MNTCASCGEAILERRAYYRPVPSEPCVLMEEPPDRRLLVETICRACYEGKSPWQTIHSAWVVDRWGLDEGSLELRRGMEEAQESALWREWAGKMEVGKEYVVRLTRRIESVTTPAQPAYRRESRSILTLSYCEHDEAAERRLARPRERSGAAA